MKNIIFLTTVIAFLTTIVITGFAKQAPNVALYNIKSERNILYNQISKMPDNGLVIINFTSIYCRPCKKEIPELLTIAKSYPNVSLIIIYAEITQKVKPHAKSMGVTNIAYVDPLSSVQLKFGVKSYPETVVINKSHKIIGHFNGYNKKNIDEIRKLAANTEHCP